MTTKGSETYIESILGGDNAEEVEQKLLEAIQRRRLQEVTTLGTTAATRELGVTSSPFQREHLGIPEADQIARANGYTLDTRIPPFTVVQYNILANELASAKHFPYVDKRYLDWNYRRALIVRDTLRTNGNAGPDIVATQELSNYADYFRDEFERFGYGSVFYPRHSLSYSSWSGYYKRDGCGVFYKRARFELVDQQGMNYADPHDRIASFVLLRDKLASDTDTKRYVMVVVTHLYWNSAAVEDQLAELTQLEARLQEFLLLAVKRLNNSRVRAAQGSLSAPASLVSPNDVSIIFCGDCNSTPDRPVYERVVTSLLRKPTEFAQAAANELAEQKTLEKVGLTDAESIAAAVVCSLQSAYANFKNLPRPKQPDGDDNGQSTTCFDLEEIITSTDAVAVRTRMSKLTPPSASATASPDQATTSTESKQSASSSSLGAFEPPVTSATSRRAECIDYIFYSAPFSIPDGRRIKPLRLQPVSILDIPDLAELQSEGGGIPSSQTGSDHMPLAATFSYAI